MSVPQAWCCHRRSFDRTEKSKLSFHCLLWPFINSFNKPGRKSSLRRCCWSPANDITHVFRQWLKQMGFTGFPPIKTLLFFLRKYSCYYLEKRYREFTKYLSMRPRKRQDRFSFFFNLNVKLITYSLGMKSDCYVLTCFCIGTDLSYSI